MVQPSPLIFFQTLTFKCLSNFEFRILVMIPSTITFTRVGAPTICIWFPGFLHCPTMLGRLIGELKCVFVCLCVCVPCNKLVGILNSDKLQKWMCLYFFLSFSSLQICTAPNAPGAKFAFVLPHNRQITEYPWVKMGKSPVVHFVAFSPNLSPECVWRQNNLVLLFFY